MVDWTGTTTFEVDLLNRITKTTDSKGNVVGYTCDATGNQTSVSYPDGTTATKTYDLLGQLKTVTETDGRTTTYTYDGMGRISKMEYPHGWVEDYHYDSIGQLLKVEDTDPTQKDMKQQKHVYEYDACGNMTYEYMRGNGTGEATVENTCTYDALHRVTSVHENYGNDNRSYAYDSLGNLTYETAQGNKSVDYKLNNLNQITSSSDDGWKTSTTYTYDKRGNLVQELYTKNNKQSVTGAYTCDETNKMVQGVNDIGESSEYLYNGLGALVTNTWIIKKNAYGYHDVQLSAVIEGETVVDADSGKKAKKEKKTAEEVTASPELNKTSTVVKEFVVDYTTETYEPLMEHEVNGLDYRYVYGNDRLSVNITGVANSSGKLIENGNQIRLYYHMDYLGTADYLTSPLTGKVESWTHYSEWGEITHNAVLKCGQRELDLVKQYATHDYDQVLGMYYAKARFYDADNRRFVAIDPILDPSRYDLREYVTDPMQLVQYLYVKNNAVNWIDVLGEDVLKVNGVRILQNRWIQENTLYYVELYELARATDHAAYGISRDANGNVISAYITYSNGDQYQFNVNAGTVTYQSWTEASHTVSIDYKLRDDDVGIFNKKTQENIYISIADFSKYHNVQTSGGYRFIGSGVQIDMSLSISKVSGSLGGEAIFYSDETVIKNSNHQKYLPDIYWYIGYSTPSFEGFNSITENWNSVLTALKEKPSLMDNAAELSAELPRGVTVSVAAFAIYGNNSFTSPTAYTGEFGTYSGTYHNVKGYIAVSSKCTVVGVGLSTQFVGCGYSRTWYDLVGDNELFDTGAPWSWKNLAEYLWKGTENISAPA